MTTAVGNPFEFLSELGIPGAFIVAVALLYVLAQILPSLKAIFGTLRSVTAWLRPARYRSANRGDIEERQRLARLLLQNLDLLEQELHWQHESFAEVRVTIEALDSPQALRSRLLPVRSKPISFRTHSLTKALERERERIVLIQGPPGSGKSVAVRHFARKVLERSAKARFKKRPLALCVSLRDFDVAPEDVTARSLRDYLISQVNAQEVPELDHYLKEQLEDDIAAGDVIVLLDSFDEIPAVFGTQNIDSAVLPYVRAISAMMGGGAARCVVSSREYKGPRVPGWTRLELLGLSFEEQVRLLARYGLGVTEVELVEPLLFDPRNGFAADLRNPLQLSLLASFVTSHGRAPKRPSELFDDYVDACLTEAAYGDTSLVDAVERSLQSFAFGLMQRPDAGLSADPKELWDRLEREAGDEVKAEEMMDIAKRSRLLIETSKRPTRPHRLAFAHRRVQEYFATLYVRNKPGVLAPRELATNPRWRETAVTLLQIAQPAERLGLLAELRATLDSAKSVQAEDRADFAWDPPVTHALELLVAAYAVTPDELPEELGDSVRKLIEAAWSDGTISDRKFALDCLPAAPADLQPELVERGFRGQSDWLRLTALRDCSGLQPLPQKVNHAIRRLLISLLAEGRLSRERRALDGDLRRLYQGESFIRLRKLLVVTPLVVLLICCLRVGYDYLTLDAEAGISWARSEMTWWVFVPLAIFWAYQSTQPLSFGSDSTIRRLFAKASRRGLGWDLDDIDTQTLALLIFAIIVLDAVVEFGFSVPAAFGDDYWAAAGGLLLGPLLIAYALGWGPSILSGVHQSWFSDKLRFYEPVLVFRHAIPAVGRRLREYAPTLIKVMLFGLLLQLVGILLILGTFFLLDHLAGPAGHVAVKVLTVFFLALLPVAVLFTVVREIQAKRRVGRATKSDDRLTPEAFIESLTAFKESSEASLYLELLRVRKPEQVRSLPRSLVRQLIRLVEPHEGSEGSVSIDELDPALLIAIERKQLTSGLLQSWGGDVLDQLGQLDEFMRAR